jgi:hypothetical protein
LKLAGELLSMLIGDSRLLAMGVRMLRLLVTVIALRLLTLRIGIHGE